MLRPTSNGLDAGRGEDAGLGEVTGKEQDLGKFRAASLKNISKRAPHMHDARFETLEAVIEHYSSGVRSHANLDPVLKNADGSPARLNLGDRDKRALVAFLKTLSDENLQTDLRFSDPFR